MKRSGAIILLLLSLHFSSFSQIWPASLVGRWTFDNTLDLTAATLGNDLVLTGSQTAVNGPQAGDGAVSIGLGSYYTCTHGIAANGGGSYVNEYSILFDVMIDNPNVYHSLFQTNQSNSNDGDAFINTYSQLGITATGYSGFSLRNKTWYRVVVTVDNGSSFRYYVNGHQVLEGIPQSVDLTYGLDPTILFFADENGEDNTIYCAQIAIFNNCLTASEVAGLAGFRSSDIKPYLQTPTPSSMYVSWISFNSSSTTVEYGLTPALGTSITGSNETVSSYRWHTAQLIGLNDDTRYYYRCISGSDTSAVYHFRTPPLPAAGGKHIRIIKVGDSQLNAGDVSRRIGDTIAYELNQLYGSEWADSVSLVMHSGDIVQSGGDVGRYMNEYFNAYAALSPYIPFMISIGNHESESSLFYQYVKYQDLTGFSERYYTFNLGRCQFIAMNTNGLYNNSTQTNWLQTQLNTSNLNPDIDFVFVYGHQPGHSEVWPDGNTSYVQNDIIPVLQSFPKVVMSTYGHAHNYERGTVLGTHAGNWDFRTILSGGAGGALDRWGMYGNQTDESDIQKSLDHYHFVLIDVDQDISRLDASVFSLGNTSFPRNLEKVDRWHRYPDQSAPVKPDAVAPDSQASAVATLVASSFSGVDTLMSSQFQLVALSGSFSSPLINVIRDTEDYYGDSGSPSYNPINLNASIDLSTYTIPSGTLQLGQSYMWRMRYRDQNVRWSEWSDTLVFAVITTGMETHEPSGEIYYYPNPSYSGVHFRFPTYCESYTTLYILDLSGVMIYSCDLSGQISADNEYYWDGLDVRGRHAPAGMYYFHFLRANESTVLKVLLQ